MRHRNSINKLGRPADQRKALLRSMTTSLVRHGRVVVTKARARAVRAETERIITLAKEGSLASRRRVVSYLYDRELVRLLFEKVSERYADRSGGYTRTVHTIKRRGDGAEMVAIELV